MWEVLILVSQLALDFVYYVSVTLLRFNILCVSPKDLFQNSRRKEIEKPYSNVRLVQNFCVARIPRCFS